MTGAVRLTVAALAMVAAAAVGGDAVAQPASAPTPVGQAVAPGAPALAATVVERLAEASAAVEDKQWQRVVGLIGAVPLDPTVPGADRAEAHRLLGIAQFHLGHYELAEAHFLAYLKLDLDGQLDIGLHAPDVVRFFDDVKAKHAAELRALRPRPRRWAVLNLVPPAGQFQNRQPLKGWVLGGLGLALLGANVGSYVMLDRWCSDMDRTCESDGTSRASSARTLKKLNTFSGVGLIGLYAYGVYDGFRHYRRNRAMVTVMPVAFGDGGGIGVAGSF